MKGICFIEPMFNAFVNGSKTQIRRLLNPQPHSGIESIWTFYEGGKPKYKKGDVLYLKEPYFIDNEGNIDYKYGKFESIYEVWKNKLFMPKKYARYFINIIDVRCERLQDISDEDCLKEGIFRNSVELTKGGIANGFSNGIDNRLYHTRKSAYKALIDKINGKGTWESNPYVWVYDYELVR